MAHRQVGLGVRTWPAGGPQGLLASDLNRGFVISRLLCWGAGLGAVLALGAHPGPHDPGGLTSPFGTLGNELVGPTARWDSHWYLLIADHGYVSPRVTAFYPLYPLLARIVGTPLDSSLLGGVIVSLISLLVALHLLQRLAALELGPQLATRTALLLAFFPMAVFFSAVYTEGLFLALTIGAFYAARTGRWPAACIAGGLATMTRPTGIVIVVPLALLYLYGPRTAQSTASGRAPLWPPPCRLRPDALWLLAVPAGLGLYMAYLAATLGRPLLMLEQNGAWHQGFTFPLLTGARAAGLAGDGLLQAAHGHTPNNVYEFVFLLVGIVATVGALRRLPLAYGAYAAAGILMIVSFPIGGQSLSGFSRYLAPLFPVLMWLAAWSSERRLYRPIVVGFGLLMVVFAARFATWHFIG